MMSQQSVSPAWTVPDRIQYLASLTGSTSSTVPTVSASSTSTSPSFAKVMEKATPASAPSTTASQLANELLTAELGAIDASSGGTNASGGLGGSSPFGTSPSGSNLQSLLLGASGGNPLAALSSASPLTSALADPKTAETLWQLLVAALRDAASPRVSDSAQSSAAPGQTSPTAADAPAPTSSTAAPSTDNAPEALRVYQHDPGEYSTSSDAAVWGGSSCSAAALTEVLRARGSTVRIGDIIKELGNGINPQQGLVNRTRLVAVAQQHGLSASDQALTMQGFASYLKQGKPALFDVTNSTFPEGHWMVATAADSSGVTVVDSSGLNLKKLTWDDFARSWSGRAILVS